MASRAPSNPNVAVAAAAMQAKYTATGALYQVDAADIVKAIDSTLVTETDSGGYSIDKAVLAAFRKLVPTATWNGSGDADTKHWA